MLQPCAVEARCCNPLQWRRATPRVAQGCDPLVVTPCAFRGAGAEAARPFVLALIFVLAGSCVLGSSVLQGQSGGVQREASLACARMRKERGAKPLATLAPGTPRMTTTNRHNPSPQPITTEIAATEP